MSRFQEAAVDEVVAQTFEGAKKAKFDANFKYRVGFPHLKTTAEGEKVSIIKVGFFPFKEDIKFSCLVTDDDALNAQVQAIMGEPRYRYATPIVIYKTDKDGKVISPPSYDVVPFVFSNDILKQLQDLNSEWGLDQVDIFLRIKENTDVKMQNLTITPTKEALWRKGAATMADIKEKATAVAKVQHTAVASDYDHAYIRTKLGLAGGEAPAQHNDAGEAPSKTPDANLAEAGDVDDWV